MNDDIIRTLGELLSANTYQGMTDDEINKVIEFKIEQAINSAVTKAACESAQQAAQAVATEQAALSQAAKAKLDVLSAPMPLQVISYE